MMLCKRGTIINILSVASVKTFTNCSVYAATKAGALAFSRSLREEVRPHNIKVIDILAGATETPLWTEESRAEFSGRMMQPDDIAEAVSSAVELARRERVSVEELLVRPRLGDL
jgi:short-subunit dehydrogenase